ncbi:hypothetical protein C8R45DRAFT_1111002 [Mycena sanguinolenta]|nr:hypothetical protein C8R45DRAFT_1111002 [Mycena sanguinolenta]
MKRSSASLSTPLIPSALVGHSPRHPYMLLHLHVARLPFGSVQAIVAFPSRPSHAHARYCVDRSPANRDSGVFCWAAQTRGGRSRGTETMGRSWQVNASNSMSTSTLTLPHPQPLRIPLLSLPSPSSHLLHPSMRRKRVQPTIRFANRGTYARRAPRLSEGDAVWILSAVLS